MLGKQEIRAAFGNIEAHFTHLGGYTVAAIGDDSVTLDGDGGPLVLQLRGQ